MTIQSMTGFARQEGVCGTLRWSWEVRSVNGKGLDCRIRLPVGYDRLEPMVREALKNGFQRGNIQATLTLAREGQAVQAVINQEALDAIVQMMESLGDRIEAAPPRWDGLLNIRGVLELREPDLDSETLAAEQGAILKGLNLAISDLRAARLAEGGKIAAYVEAKVTEIHSLAVRVDEDPSRTPTAIGKRLAEQVKLLLDSGAELDMNRIHQEAAMLASKADLREEIDRLYAHVEACRRLLEETGPVGRKLDFLAQEFNREANTICSKSNAASVTAIGLELKVIIDQFREQIQNLE
ncbi:YicC/YloC family endoribonuclease [Hoeflea sp. CAU 1731]